MLMDGNNLMCFALEFPTQCEPDIIKGLSSDAEYLLGRLSELSMNSTKGLKCPESSAPWNTSTLAQFPEYTKLNSDGTY